MHRPLVLTGITILVGAGLLVACGTSDTALSTEEYCQLITTYQNEGDAFDTLFSGSDTDPETLKAGFETMGKMIDNLAAKAPAEIKADVASVAKATNGLIDLLEKYDYDFMTMAMDEAASAELETLMGGVDVDAASARLDEWGKTNCGIEPES